MRIFMGFAEYQKFMVRRFTRYIKDMDTAHGLLAREMKKVFMDGVSGKIDRAERKKMGWPYSRIGKLGMKGIDASFWGKRIKVDTKLRPSRLVTRKDGITYTRRAKMVDVYKKRTKAYYRTSGHVAFRRYTDSYGKKRIKSQITQKGSVSLLPINVNTGKLKAMVTLDKPSRMDPSRTFKLYSRAKHNKFVLAILGTVMMVARGFLGPNGYLRQKHKELKLALIAAHKKSLRKN